MNIKVIRNKSQRGIIKKDLFNKQNLKNITVFLLCSFFILGIIAGLFYFKNLITTNFLMENSNILENLKIIDSESINHKNLFIEIIIRNIIMLIFMWIVGLSILGGPLLIIFVLYDGFSFGITLSYVLNTFGFYDGYSFLFSKIYLITIINTGIMIILCNSALRATLNILKQKTSLRIEFVRHSLVCIIMLFLLLISSFIEVAINNVL